MALLADASAAIGFPKTRITCGVSLDQRIANQDWQQISLVWRRTLVGGLWWAGSDLSASKSGHKSGAQLLTQGATAPTRKMTKAYNKIAHDWTAATLLKQFPYHGKERAEIHSMPPAIIDRFR